MRNRTTISSAGLFSGMSSDASGTWISYPFTDDGDITDELHTWPGKVPGLGDSGGLLQQYKYSVEPGATASALLRWPLMGGWWYYGPLFARYPHSGSVTNHLWWSKTAPLTEAILFTKGATAISRCAPTNPHASLSQALGEIRRDGIPAVPGLTTFAKGVRPRLQKAKGKRGKKTSPSAPSMAGSEYLNVEFGWKPLLSDIRKLARAGRDSERVIGQYVRDSGRLVRRRYEFPTEDTTVVENLGRSYPAPVNLMGGAAYYVLTGNLTKTVRTIRRVWFSGAFTYHVNGGSDLASRAVRFAQEANHLLGAGITPAVAWDLMPYSWAVDWVTNIGDVINNASMMASDGLVVVYGYIMAETTTVATYTLEGVQVMENSPAWSASAQWKTLPPLTQVFTEVVRQRRRANSFGFGLAGEAATARQLAIVAALGLSRDGRKLAL